MVLTLRYHRNMPTNIRVFLVAMAAEQVVTGSNSAICTFKTGHKRLKDISPLKYVRAVILDSDRKRYSINLQAWTTDR
jgi:hypothetical protein